MYKKEISNSCFLVTSNYIFYIDSKYPRILMTFKKSLNTYYNFVDVYILDYKSLQSSKSVILNYTKNSIFLKIHSEHFVFIESLFLTNWKKMYCVDWLLIFLAIGEQEVYVLLNCHIHQEHWLPAEDLDLSELAQKERQLDQEEAACSSKHLAC